ncbi:FHA domain-containing protein, partial [Clavibacter phaseoli]
MPEQYTSTDTTATFRDELGAALAGLDG